MSLRALLLAALAVAGCQRSSSVSITPPVAVPPALHDQVLPAREPSPGSSPVLVMLHGVGSNEQDLLGLARHLDPRFTIHSLRAPIAMGPNAFGWFQVRFTSDGPVHNVVEAEAARLALVAFFKELRTRPDVDADHVFVLGFSQGAILGISLALTEPTLFTGVVASSGRTLQEVAAGVRGRTIDGGPAMLLTHGTSDTKLPFSHGTASKAVLEAAGLDVDFRAYDAGHELNAAMVNDIGAWLTARLPPRG